MDHGIELKQLSRLSSLLNVTFPDLDRSEAEVNNRFLLYIIV